MYIGYISPTDPFEDKTSWSGTYFNTRKAIEESGNRIEWVKYSESKLGAKICRKLYRIFFGKGLYDHSRLAGKICVKSIKDDLSKYDLLFIPGQSAIVSELKVDVPILHYSDATAHLMFDYYWFNFSDRAVKEAEVVEQNAIDNSAYNLLASQWAADSALKNYNAVNDKVFVLPFGSGIDEKLIQKATKYDKKKLKVIFSGVDWKRKGGEIAYETVRILNERGIKSELLICGIRDLPQYVKNASFVTNLGFLNKNNAEDLKKYCDAWKTSNLLLLPTRAECAGIVFSEASAYGVPVLTTDTGGIGSYVVNGVNGKRLNLMATADDYANVIESWIERDELSRLADNACAFYKNNISWKAWGKKFSEIIGKLGRD